MNCIDKVLLRHAHRSVDSQVDWFILSNRRIIPEWKALRKHNAQYYASLQENTSKFQHKRHNGDDQNDG